MGRGTFSSHSRYHLPKKRTNVSSQNPTLQTPSFPKVPRSRRGRRPPYQKPHEITVEYAHKALLLPCDEAEHDAPITYRLIGAYRYDTCITCVNTHHTDVVVGWAEGNRSLTPVREPSPFESPPSLPWWRVARLPQIHPRAIFFSFNLLCPHIQG
jgi:hypothetical protein